MSIDDKILELIMAYEPLLRHTIGLDVDNPADVDDVYQETLLAILEHFRKGRQVEHPKAWVVKIAKRKCVDFHRRDKSYKDRNANLASFINRTVIGGVRITDEQHQAVVEKEIRNVITGMKSIYRDVGELHIQGYTNREISEQLGIPEGTVQSRLRKFRKLIREYLEMDTLGPK